MAAGDVEVSIATPDARQCAKFDGVDDYINAGNGISLNISGNLTLSARIKTLNNTKNQRIIDKHNNGAGGYLFGVYTDSKLVFFAAGGGGSVYSLDTISNNQWTNVAFKYDGTNIIFYINGLQSGTSLWNTGIAQVSTNLWIGGRALDDKYFKGTIEEVRIYNRALSTEEVAKLYGGIHITDGLVGYWPLKSDYLDYSGNGNNGTNSGSVLVTSDGPVAKAIADKRVNSSDRYFAIDVNGGSQIVTGRIQEA